MKRSSHSGHAFKKTVLAPSPCSNQWNRQRKTILEDLLRKLWLTHGAGDFSK